MPDPKPPHPRQALRIAYEKAHQQLVSRQQQAAEDEKRRIEESARLRERPLFVPKSMSIRPERYRSNAVPFPRDIIYQETNLGQHEDFKDFYHLRLSPSEAVEKLITSSGDNSPSIEELKKLYRLKCLGTIYSLKHGPESLVATYMMSHRSVNIATCVQDESCSNLYRYSETYYQNSLSEKKFYQYYIVTKKEGLQRTCAIDGLIEGYSLFIAGEKVGHFTVEQPLYAHKGDRKLFYAHTKTLEQLYLDTVDELFACGIGENKIENLVAKVSKTHPLLSDTLAEKYKLCSQDRLQQQQADNRSPEEKEIEAAKKAFLFQWNYNTVALCESDFCAEYSEIADGMVYREALEMIESLHQLGVKDVFDWPLARFTCNLPDIFRKRACAILGLSDLSSEDFLCHAFNLLPKRDEI
jgi:hypothetical protein